MAIKINLPILGQPNPNEPKDVHLVGRYAVGVTWADDHSSIYPFERLRLDDPARTGEAESTLTDALAARHQKAVRSASRHVVRRSRERLPVSHAPRAVPVRRLHGRPLMAESHR
jgi:Gamma-butyrobetaine hydroxylase-like, N-terminal